VERTFHRIVLSNPPTLADFRSDKAKGKQRPTDPAKLHLYEGRSVYATLAQAHRKALDFPLLGEYIAELRVSETEEVRVARTVMGSRGHHTIWGDPADLLGTVTTVVPVTAEESE